MRVGELMREVVIIDSHATLRDAAQRMESARVGALVVCDDGRMVGIVTARDIVIRGIAAGRPSAFASVSEVMSAPVHYCLSDADASVAQKLLTDYSVWRLPVLDPHTRRLVGLIEQDAFTPETLGHEWRGTWNRPMHIDEKSHDPLTVARMTDHNVRGVNGESKPRSAS